MPPCPAFHVGFEGGTQVLMPEMLCQWSHLFGPEILFSILLHLYSVVMLGPMLIIILDLLSNYHAIFCSGAELQSHQRGTWFLFLHIPSNTFDFL